MAAQASPAVIAGASSSHPSCSLSPTTTATTPPGFPVPAASFDAAVGSVATRFVVASFSDCFFVSATQTGALGTIMKVTRAVGRGGAIGGGDFDGAGTFSDGGIDDDGDRRPSTRPRPPLASFDVTSLSGRRDSPVLEASARSLASCLVSLGVERPAVMVCLALRDDGNAAMARDVVAKLKEAIEATTG